MQSATGEIHPSGGSGAGSSATATPRIDPSSPPRRVRLGIYFNLKKRRQFVAPLFTQSHYEVAHPHDGGAVRVEVVVVETDQELDAKGPFDILLLKLTDAMTCAQYSSDPIARRAAQESLQRVRDSIERQRQTRPVTLVESFERVQAVLDRATIQALVQRMVDENGGGGRLACAIPDAFLYQQASSALSDSSSDDASATTAMSVHRSLPSSLRFPVICKSVAACGSDASHRMYVLQRAADFDIMHEHDAAHAATPLSPDAQPPVWLVQQYVNHTGMLYKVYVLDQELQVVAKSSLPDVHADFPCCYLNSQDMVLRPLQSQAEAPLSAAGIAAAAAAAAVSASAAHAAHMSSSRVAHTVPPDVMRVAQACAQQLRERLQLSLFGFDLIRSADGLDGTAGRCFLVDVNYFPSYKGTLNDLPAKLLSICVARHANEGGMFTPATADGASDAPAGATQQQP